LLAGSASAKPRASGLVKARRSLRSTASTSGDSFEKAACDALLQWLSCSVSPSSCSVAARKNLSRDKAKRLIVAQSHCPQALSDVVFNGRKWRCAADDPRLVKRSFIEAGILCDLADGPAEGPAMGNPRRSAPTNLTTNPRAAPYQPLLGGSRNHEIITASRRSGSTSAPA
jgi:hypothetical protein